MLNRATGLILLFVGLWGFGAESAYGQSTQLYFTGSGSSIAGRVGGALPRSITLGDGHTFASLSAGGLVEFNIANFVGSNNDYWTVSFAGIGGQRPTVGTYGNAKKYGTDSTQNGLNFAGNGVFDTVVSGRFQVLEAVYDSGGNVTAFAADFVQYDEADVTKWNAGSLRYNSSLVVAATPVIVSPVTISTMLGKTVVYQIAATRNPISYGFGWMNPVAGAASFDQYAGIFTVTPMVAGTYSFTVSAQSGAGSSVQTVVLTVTGEPVITSAITINAAAGVNNTYQVTATNNPSTYGFSWITPAQGPASFNSSTGTFTFAPSFTGTYQFRVTATNSAGTSSQNVTVTAGMIPSFYGYSSLSVNLGQSYNGYVGGFGNDVTTSATWLNGASPGPVSINSYGYLTFTPTVSGTYQLLLTATNIYGTGSQTLPVVVTAVPSITSSTYITATVGQSLSYQITASNSPTSFGFGWSNNAAPGPAGFNPTTGVFTLTPTVAGNYTFQVAAGNSSGSNSQYINLYVNGPPVISGPSLYMTAVVGQTSTYYPSYSYSYNSLGFGWVIPAPGAAAFNGYTFTITPTAAGTYYFSLQATNSYGSTVSTITLVVVGPPVITSPTVVAAVAGQTVTYQTVAGGGTTGFGFGWISPAQGAASFNTSTGLLTVTPGAAGNYSFTVIATNPYGSTTQSVMLLVSPNGPGGGLAKPAGTPNPVARDATRSGLIFDPLWDSTGTLIVAEAQEEYWVFTINLYLTNDIEDVQITFDDGHSWHSQEISSHVSVDDNGNEIVQIYVPRQGNQIPKLRFASAGLN